MKNSILSIYYIVTYFMKFSTFNLYYLHSNISDILIEIPDDEIGIVIEVKYGEKSKLEDACQDALQQIEDKNYVERLEDNGMETIFKYGIGCFNKKCKVVLGE